MSFDPSKFTAPKAKPLPVILPLDASGSMSGDKVRNLNDAVRDMLNTFSNTENGETEIHVAIITFGSQVTLHQPLASASTIHWLDLSAGGMTPLGTALQMAKAMIEDKDVLSQLVTNPSNDALSILANAIWREQNDEWALQRRYMTLETLAEVGDNPLVSLSAVTV